MIALSTLALIAVPFAQDAELRVPLLDGVPLVSTPQSQAVGSELRLYDLADLTGYARMHHLIAGFVPASGPVELEGALARFERLEHMREEVQRTTDSMLATIREMIVPPLDSKTQRVEHLEHGKIALVGNAAQHQWMTGFLTAAHEFDGVVLIETRIFKLEPGQLAELSQVRSGEVLDFAEVKVLCVGLQRAGIETVTAPRIATLPFQRAELSIVNQVAYISDYEVKVLPDLDQEIADPIVDVVQSGLTMTVRAVPMEKGSLGILADLEYSVLDLPIPTSKVMVGASHHEMTIQVPHVTRIKLEGQFRLMPGQTLLMATVDPAGENEVLTLLTATRIPASAASFDEDR